MTDALDQAARSALERFVQRSRRLLEDDLARHAEGRFGIHAADGTIEDEDGLHLSPDDLAARRDIVDVLHFIRREESDHAAAAARLIREAAFTHLNRLVAIRIAEAIGLLSESIANGPASAGYRELLEVAPLLAHASSGGYWRYLQLCGDELAADLPQLFDPRNPLLEFTPSPAAFDELIEQLTAAELCKVWDAPDALGWAYQFFNSGDERRSMRDASPSPRSSRELAVRNQFFTPRYVVDFLVHNSLGRRLVEADPNSPLIDDLPLLLDAPTEPGEPLGLADVRVLDPACGSGHFLLGAYDVLERAWRHAGIEADAAAPYIVASLWGIDIDPRCAQVAAAAIVLRARRSCRHRDLPSPNIICARALPEPTEGWDMLLAGLPEDRRQLVAAMRDVLDQAPVLGPLLKVEERLTTEIRAHVAGADDADGTLFAAAGIANDVFAHAEADVLAALRDAADQTTSTPAERLFAAEANDAIRFVEALSHRYDAVLMNPPFGEPVASTKAYLKSAYPWIPTRDFNLLAAFVGRGLELCTRGGYLGAITSRAGMFLKTFEEWRQEVLLGNRLVALADLGFGVMEQALVEAAAYVIGRSSPQASDYAVFARLLKDTDLSTALNEVATSYRAGRHDSRVFVVPLADFRAVPGSPVAYSMSPSLRRLFGKEARLEGNGGEVRVGLQTGDDFRFLRAFWEVQPEAVGHSRTDTLAGRRWVPFAKGGEYSPFISDVHLVVNWMNDGSEVRSFRGSVVRNPQFFFRAGLTWPARTNSAFAPQLLPSGSVFSHRGHLCAPVDGDDRLLLLAWLNSRFTRYIIETLAPSAEETRTGGVPSRDYTSGMIQALPWPAGLHAVRSEVNSAMVKLLSAARGARITNEATLEFTGLRLLRNGGALADAVSHDEAERTASAVSALSAAEQLDLLVAGALGASCEDLEMLDETVGPAVASLPVDPLTGEEAAKVSAAWCLPMADLISEVVTRIGAVRFVNLNYHLVDRRLEVLCWGWNRHPQVIANHKPTMLPWSMSSAAEDVVSYVFGLAIGRWDVTSARFDEIDAWQRLEPLPAAPPGLLDESLAVGEFDPGYPIGIAPHGLLLDETGQDWDIERRLVLACQAWRSGDDSVLSDAVAALGRSQLRDYLRGSFFRDHLSRYSKSRRKAPIYWPLYVPSGGWGVWVYAPRLTRETLYVVASEALRREGHSEVEIERLERERAAGDGGRGAKALDKALDEERKLAEELRRFRQEAERIAGLGWEPNLDDGIVLCAAPLADLLPQWRKELAGYRDELRAGKYEWSTVSKWADQL